jgi:hypothetical protein
MKGRLQTHHALEAAAFKQPSHRCRNIRVTLIDPTRGFERYACLRQPLLEAGSRTFNEPARRARIALIGKLMGSGAFL